MILVLGLLISLACFVLPIRHAFGVCLSSSFLLIVPGGIAINTYLFIAIAARLLLARFYRREYSIKLDRIGYIFIAFFVLGLISFVVFRGDDAFEYLKRFLVNVVIVIIFLNAFKEEKHYDLLMKYLAVGLVLILIHIYSQTLLQINPFAQVEISRQGRVFPAGMSNQYVNPNLWGAQILWCFGMIFGYLLLYKPSISKVSKKQILLFRVLMVISVGASIPVLAMLASRAVILIMFMLTFVIFFKWSFIKTALASMAFLFLVTFVGLSLQRSIENYIAEQDGDNLAVPLLVRFVNNEREDSNLKNSRSYLWLLGIRVFMDHPFMGVGLGNEIDTMKDPKYFGSGKVSHNTIISLLVEFGLMGIPLMIALASMWIRYFNHPFVFATLLMIGSYAMVHSIMLISLPWLVLSICYKLIDQREKNKLSLAMTASN